MSQRQGDHVEREAGILGDVLFPDKARPQVPERDWAALVRAVAGRDQRALQALYLQTHRMVLTLITRIVGSRETAEELTLDVFHDVWRRAPEYDPSGGSVIGWILNQARSRAIDRLRYETRKKRVPGVHEPVPPSAAGPHEALAAVERGRRLRAALQALTADERKAIETAFFAEMSYGEAAARLEEPVGTVKTRIRSGLAKLRLALAGSVET